MMLPPSELWVRHGRTLLTPRQEAILDLLTQGLTNREIAAELGLRYWTAKNHLTQIYQRLAVSGRVQAALWWVTYGAAVRHSRQEEAP